VDKLELHDFRLTPDSFPAFYFFLTGLRFPVPVSLVLDLRSALHYSADTMAEPRNVPHRAAFRQALAHAVASFGIEENRHRERLLKVLIMLRGLHQAHTQASRDAERNLRSLIENQNRARVRCVRNGLFSVGAAATCFLVWVAMAAPDWRIKALTAGFAVLAFSFFRGSAAMERETARLTQQLNDVLRRRIHVIRWKTLIHKLALLLGYKRISGVEIFHADRETDELSVAG
jgi:hypothetical protein